MELSWTAIGRKMTGKSVRMVPREDEVPVVHGTSLRTIPLT